MPSEPDNNDVWIGIGHDRVKVPNWAAMPARPLVDRAEMTFRLEVSSTDPVGLEFLKAMVLTAIQEAAHETARFGRGTVTAYHAENRSMLERGIFDNEPL